MKFVKIDPMVRTKKASKILFLPPLSAFVFFSCSVDYFREAELLQKDGQILKAAQYYETFAARNPQDALADISLYRAATIYSENFGMCGKSAEIFEKLVRDYPKSEFNNASYSKVFVCPDYFPVEKVSKWYYGDSQSKGQNARETIFIKSRDKETARAEYSLYAGRKLVDRRAMVYALKDLVFVQIQGKTRIPLIKYPVKKGMRWNSYKTPGIYYEISDTNLQVRVKAGEFSGCIKIVEFNKGAGYGLASYYAPGVGRVLTSMESGGKENRIMELLKYE